MNRRDVLQQALATLDAYGFADLSMRRLAASLGVQPGALYWHFASKQALLLAIAEEILAPIADTTEASTSASSAAPGAPAASGAPAAPGGPAASGVLAASGWEEDVRAWAHRLHAALLAHRDGAELVASVLALRPPDLDPARPCVAALTAAGMADPEADAAAAALVHYTVGHAVDAQNHAQARALGVREVTGQADEEATAADRFDFGLEVFLAGLRHRIPSSAL